MHLLLRPLSHKIRIKLLWASGLACVLIAVIMAQVQKPLITGDHPVPAVNLQRAGTAEAAHDILEAWKEHLPDARQGVYWDFTLIAAYVLFLSLLSLPHLKKGLPAGPGKIVLFAAVIGWLPLLGGLADIMEDFGLLAMLDGTGNHLDRAHITTLFSTIKFSLLGLSVVCIALLHAGHSADGVLRAAGRWIMWIFLLRVPLLVTLSTALLPSFYLFDFGPTDMVAGAFDANEWQFWFVGLLLGLLAGSIIMNGRLVLQYGEQRYHLPGAGPIPGVDGIRILEFIVALACLPAAFACVKLFHAQKPFDVQSNGKLAAYALSGMAGAYAGLFLMFRLVGKHTRTFWKKCAKEKTGLWGWVNHQYEKLGEGYWLKGAKGTGCTLPGHLASAAFGAVAWTIFLVMQAIPMRMPAITYVLLLLLAACWTLSTLTFWLDRYRVPLLFVLAFWIWIIGFCPRSEYYFEVAPPVVLKADDSSKPAKATLPTAEWLLKKSMLRTSAGDRFPILVTAQGGGIHAGAWATEVLTGLEELAREKKGGPSFSRNVRAVSGVSGGSYGLLFFADAYKNGELPQGEFPKEGQTFDPDLNIQGRPPADALGLIRALAMRDSLSAVVKGLVYRDVWNDFFVLGKGLDRASRMERRWAEGTDLSFAPDGKVLTLNEWVKDAMELKRPAVFFNSTSVETGRPVVFGTSWVRDWMFEDNGDASQIATVPVVTGARLSAAFPFISAAARPVIRRGGPAVQPLHYVDGGFYDNYGIVTLSHWMQDGLLGIYGQDFIPAAAGPPIPGTLLVIQIRYKASQTPAEAKAKTRGNGMLGGLFQEAAPLETLANVRSAAQTLRNSEEFDVFTRYWADRHVKIENASFDFALDAPLSWHLTETEKQRLETQRKDMKEQYHRYAAAVPAFKVKAEQLGKDLLSAAPANIQTLKDELKAVLGQWDALKAECPLGAPAWEVMTFLGD